MNKVIKKLNSLKNPESFVQVNTLKGFKYVDRAGEIVNEYHTGDAPPQFTMNLNGLVINDPTNKIDQLKITPQTIWMKSSEVDSLDMVATSFSKESKKILEVLEVEYVSRVGWRNFFVYEFNDEKDQEEYLKKFSVLSGAKPVAVRMNIETGKDFNVSLQIQPVEKDDDEKTKGVLFDIDIYKSSKISVAELPKILTQFRQFLSDEKGFLNIVNESFT